MSKNYVPIVQPAVVSTITAARMLNISKPTLLKLIKQGKLASYLDGSRRKVTTESINAFVAERVASAGPIVPIHLQKQEAQP